MRAQLQDQNLDRTVASVVLVQQLVLVGRMASNTISNRVLARVLSVLSIFLFEIAFIKPGCAVGRISYVAVLWWDLLSLSLCVSS